MNTLYYGDNLDILRRYVADESVDLVYLDPPFNSNRSYNVLFQEVNGVTESAAQIGAFEDTWTWDAHTEATFHEIAKTCPPKLVDMINGFVSFLGRNEMTAYLVMMAIRLVELHRVLKPTGTLFLHCDPTAGHYLKIVLDVVFGKDRMINQITWKRTSAHSDYKQGAKHMGRISDLIFWYAKGSDWTYNVQFTDYEPEYVQKEFRYTDPDGRRYKTADLTAAKPGGDVEYEWKGVKPSPGRFWAYSKANMERFEAQGRLHYSTAGRPRLKIYLDESLGVPLQDLWTDIQGVHFRPTERLGYPTQKPVALLARIVSMASNPGDVVLDPFCVAGDTLIVTREGLRPICDVQEGHYVLTHKGRFRRVVRRYEREYSGEMLTITRARSNVGIEITPNHPILAVRAVACPYEDRRCLPRTCHYHRQGRHLDCPRYRDQYRLEWIPAGEVQPGDWVFYPATQIAAPESVGLPDSSHYNAVRLPDRLPVTPAMMEWLGYFAAEGCVDTNSVLFTNYEDAERIAYLGGHLFGLQAAIHAYPYRSKRIRFNSRALSRWLEQTVGRGAASKRLPEWVMGVDHPLRRALLRALLRSDGSFRRHKADDESRSYRYASASPTLSHQVMRLLLVEGVTASFHKYRPSQRNRAINGKPIRVNHPSYQVAVYDVVGVNRLLEATREAPAYREDVVRQPYDSYPFDSGWLYSVKRVAREMVETKVFNLEVEEDHSYVTATFTVHNCGCGTTIAAAEGLGREWIGIDLTHLAINLIKTRLKDMFPACQFQVVGEPQDEAGARELAAQNRHQFEYWALALVGARPAQGAPKKGADTGVDGVLYAVDDPREQPKKVVVQVKSGKVSVAQVRDFAQVIQREKAIIGLFLTLEQPTRPMLTEATTAGVYERALSNIDTLTFPRLQILTIADLLAGKKPDVPSRQVTYRAAPRAREGGQQLSLLDAAVDEDDDG